MPSMNVPLYRGDSRLDLDVDYVTPRTRGWTGVVAHRAAVYSKSERSWVEVQLSPTEWTRVEEFISDNAFEF